MKFEMAFAEKTLGATFRVFTLMVGLLRIHFNVASSLAVIFQLIDI